jgi:hypothetical protein
MALTGALIIVTSAQAPDPLAFLQPIVALTADDRRGLDRGDARVRILAGQGREVVTVAIVATTIDAARLLAWVDRIEAMKKSAAVHTIQRFSDPPRLEDLAALTLSTDALNDIRRCRPGSCGLKLGAAEMTALQAAIAKHADWQPRLQTAFRGVVLQRVTAYLSRGHAGVPAYDDTKPPRVPADAFAALLARSHAVVSRIPDIATTLAGPPPPPSTGKGFLYWSVEQYGGKPVLSVSDVRISQPADPQLPAVVVTGKQAFAMHYMNGSLNHTMLLRGRAGGPNYLVVLNRSEIDVVGGMLGGLARAIIERRVRNEAGVVLEALRTRLQSNLPPVR